MGLWSTVGGVAGGIFGGPAGAAAGASLGSMGDEVHGAATANKVAGVPTPLDPITQGTNYRNFMDQAYPGTTPWERLGASSPGYGSISSADINAKNQLRLQEKELGVRERIAEKTNLASIVASSSIHGAQTLDSAVSKYMTGGLAPATPAPSPNTRAEELQPDAKRKLQAEADEALSRAKSASSKAAYDEEMKKYAGIRAKMDVIDKGLGIAGRAVGSVVGGVFGAGLAGRSARLASTAMRNLRGTGKVPPRFTGSGNPPSDYDYSHGHGMRKRKSN